MAKVNGTQWNFQEKNQRVSRVNSEFLRNSISHHMCQDGSVNLPSQEVDAIIRNLSRKEKKISKLWWALGFAAIFSVALFALTFASALSANEASKESHVSGGTLEDLDGNTVEVTEAVVFTTLGELPQMSPDFLEQLDKVTFLNMGFLEIARVDNIRYGGSNSLELSVGGSGTIRINGPDDVKLHRDGEVSDISGRNGCNDARRVLADAAGGEAGDHVARVYTEEQLHKAARALMEHELLDHRALDNMDGEGLASLYYFLGGIAQSTHVNHNEVGAYRSCLCDGETVFNNAAHPEDLTGSVGVWEVENMDGSKGMWYMDYTNTETPRLRIDTYSATNNIFVQEFHGATEYNWQVEDFEGMRETFSGECPSDEDLQAIHLTCDEYRANMLESLTNIEDMDHQENHCVSTVVEHENSPFANSAVDLCPLGKDPQGRPVITVGGYNIIMDFENNPVEIGYAHDSFQCHNDCVETWPEVWTTYATVTQVRSLPGDSADDIFVGCEEQTGAQRRLKANHESRVEGRELAGRRLGAWQDFQAWASNTVWCGVGTDIVNTACPAVAGGDTTANYACHRHDHGKKANGIIGGYAVRLGCDIDRGLADRSSNWAVQAAFGSWGIAQTWGCYDHGSYSCWNWKSKWWGGYWRYGSYCSGEHTHYGPWRYSSYSHSYGWNSQSRCSNPLPWGTGQI